MSKKVGILACFIVVAMDITAGILSLKAEAAQNQAKHMRLWLFECKDPSHLAFKLGLAAVVLLSLAHVLANLIGGWTACAKQDISKASPTKHCSLACLFLTWIVLALGLYLLVTGIRANNKSSASCGFSHHHFLSIGGICCFVHGVFSTGYYITASEILKF
ncbi:protein DESIGUAL 3-like [Impatiens glandulifera]|uniref:protein DESIGUAL 3-like n=1 Tax=Impatiens glandulifera TaxID=253017 RepID=UPI001FB07E40|nr:protein DESIGUAL 3-like [Impatiens glandulifera]